MKESVIVPLKRRRELCEKHIEVDAGGAIRMARVSGCKNTLATVSWSELLRGGTREVELSWEFAWHVLDSCQRNHERPML